MNQINEEVYKKENYTCEKAPIIFLTHTIVKPHAMVIEFLDASVTRLAVFTVLMAITVAEGAISKLLEIVVELRGGVL